jgi:hypothetical protein
MRYTRIPAQVLADDRGDLRVELHRGQSRVRVEPRQDPGSGHAGARAEIERPRAGLGRRQRAQQRASPRSAGHVEADGPASYSISAITAGWPAVLPPSRPGRSFSGRSCHPAPRTTKMGLGKGGCKGFSVATVGAPALGGSPVGWGSACAAPTERQQEAPRSNSPGMPEIDGAWRCEGA